jgi:signal transduction histidine kinase
MIHESDVEPVCNVDRHRVEQVFRNILENAIAACSDPVEIEVRFSDATLGGKPAVRLSIRDNGPGFTPEQKRRIFEPFFTTKTHGTGLGMAICQRIVDAHGGDLRLGDGGSGAELLVLLPRVVESPGQTR